MAKRQKQIILAGLLCIVLMGLFPPWIATKNGDSGGIERPIGFIFLFKPPTTTAVFGGDCDDERHAQWRCGFRINAPQLLFQWLGIVLVVIGLVLVSKEKIGRVGRQ